MASTRPTTWQNIRKYGFIASAGLVSLAIAEAGYLSLTYTSPPDCVGPNDGIVIIRNEVAKLRHSLDLSSSKHKFTSVFERFSRNALRDEWKAMQQKASMWRDRTTDYLDKRVYHRHQHTPGNDTLVVEDESKGERIILVLGDSLVSGVGCCCDDAAAQETCKGPALARKLGSSLAEILEVSIHWKAIGITGGSVSEITQHVIPRIQALNDDVKNRIIAVVIVCGVNDWKRAWKFWDRQRIDPSKFGDELASLISQVRESLGADVRVVLPAIQAGVYFAPRFPQPLRRVISTVSGVWDEEKRKISEKLDHVLYVDVDWKIFDKLENRDVSSYYSRLDGIHPNADGYSVMAEGIAKKMVESNFMRGLGSLVPNKSA